MHKNKYMKIDTSKYNLSTLFSNEYLQHLKAFILGKCMNPCLWVTTRCNSRCNICNIWRKKIEDMPIEVVEKVVNSKNVIGRITVVGGEFILHPKINEIMDTIRETKLKIAIGTNGILTKKIVNFVDEYKPELTLISLDTLNPKTYEKVRGVDKLDHVLKTITQLKELNVRLGLNFTINPFNSVKDSLDVLEFGKQNEIPVYFTVYCTRKYYDTHIDFDPLKFGYDNLISTKSLCGLKEWLQGRIFPCYSIRTYAEILPNGDMYFCPHLGFVIGNLRHENFDDVWKRCRKESKKWVSCNQCFNNCNRPIDKVIDDLKCKVGGRIKWRDKET
jgi:MoaA/NifB/PqqE/SkfB family radical SAM enzyme